LATSTSHFERADWWLSEGFYYANLQ